MIGIFEGIAGMTARRCGGMWRFLAERVHARKAIELERARNEATMAILPQLKPGTDFYESEPGGRTRLIRMAPAPEHTAPVSPSTPEMPRGQIPS
ncbi:hypothetical protein ACWCQW_52930 [Streptomyces mirabilis]